MKLKDKVALITGAAQGIGLACAQAFAREGARVMLADNNELAARSAAGTLGAAGASIGCDVSRKADVDRAVAATVERFGRVDILVANAGIVHAAEFLDLEESDFDRVLGVNLKGAFLAGQAVARQIVKQGTTGAIINMSSVNAVLAIPNQVPYVVSKGGINQLTKAMAISLAPHAIRVNAVGPGTIQTPLLDGVIKDAAFRTKVLSRTPIGRFGQPDEVAAIVAWLASEESSYVTGTTVYADGGRLPLNYVVPVRE